MLTKSDLEALARMRIKDAQILHTAGSSSSAYYLAGYSIEMGLKACIAGIFQSNSIPDKQFVNAIYSHQPDQLLNLAGLRPAFKLRADTDSLFAGNWGVVSQWSEQSRYQAWDPISSASLISAIADPNHGIFQWVTTHW